MLSISSSLAISHFKNVQVETSEGRVMFVGSLSPRLSSVLSQPELSFLFTFHCASEAEI